MDSYRKLYRTDIKHNPQAMDLIYVALQNLAGPKGASLKTLTRCVTDQYDVDEDEMVIPVFNALRRGVAFGFLKREGRKYRLVKKARLRTQKALKRAGRPIPFGRKHSRKYGNILSFHKKSSQERC